MTARALKRLVIAVGALLAMAVTCGVLPKPEVMGRLSFGRMTSAGMDLRDFAGRVALHNGTLSETLRELFGE